MIASRITPGLSGLPATDANCRAIQCLELSQEEAGFDTLVACSQKGYAGVWPPDCPNHSWNKRASGELPPDIPAIPPAPLTVEFVTPLHAEDVTLTPEAQPPMPSIVAEARLEATRVEMANEGALCKVNRWVSANPGMSLIALAGLYYLASRKGTLRN